MGQVSLASQLESANKVIKQMVQDMAALAAQNLEMGKKLMLDNEALNKSNSTLLEVIRWQINPETSKYPFAHAPKPIEKISGDWDGQDTMAEDSVLTPKRFFRRR